jgi:hypothetical protein
VIGGRVLDLSALLAFARQDSVYAAALVWTAVEEDIVLLVPSSAAGPARALLEDRTDPVLDVLLGLPVTVVDELGAARAREVGRLLRGHDVRFDLAHAALCSRQRRWPVVTAEPSVYDALETDLEIEPLP